MNFITAKDYFLGLLAYTNKRKKHHKLFNSYYNSFFKTKRKVRQQKTWRSIDQYLLLISRSGFLWFWLGIMWSNLGDMVKQLTGSDDGQYPIINSWPIKASTFGLFFGSGCIIVMIIVLAAGEMFPTILQKNAFNKTKQVHLTKTYL